MQVGCAEPLAQAYLAVLARRAAGQRGRVKQLLDTRLNQLRGSRDKPPPLTAAQAPQGSAGHTRALAELTLELTQHAAQCEALVFDPASGQPGESSATCYFRATWSRLSTDKRVTQALAQAPKNAGPINAHKLVLASLAAMRQISPDYLLRFTAYVDTLIGLAQHSPANGTLAKTPKPANVPKRAKKTKKGA